MAWRGGEGVLVAGLLVASVISVGVWPSPACATLKGIDLGDLDSDPIGKATNAEIHKMKKLEESKKTPEDKAFEQELNAMKDRMRVVDMGRRMNPDLWGPNELQLFKETERLGKKAATMYTVGGALSAMGLGLLGRTGIYDSRAVPLYVVSFALLLLSTPMWVVGKKASQKRGRKIKAIYEAERKALYDKIAKEKYLRMSKEMPNDDGEDYRSERGTSDREVEPLSPVAEDGKN